MVIKQWPLQSIQVGLLSLINDPNEFDVICSKIRDGKDAISMEARNNCGRKNYEDFIFDTAVNK